MKKFFRHPLVIGIIIVILGGIGFLIKYYFFNSGKHSQTASSANQSGGFTAGNNNGNYTDRSVKLENISFNNSTTSIQTGDVVKNSTTTIINTPKAEIVSFKLIKFNDVVNSGSTGTVFSHEAEIHVSNAYNKKLKWYIKDDNTLKIYMIPESGVSFFGSGTDFTNKGSVSVRMFKVNFTTDYKINPNDVSIGVDEL